MKFVKEKLMQVQIKSNNTLWICQTCRNGANNGITPRLCLNESSGLRFSSINSAIAELNDIEERICSPRIAFLQIRPLSWDRQNGLRGNVVNVPLDVDNTLQMLPREFKKCEVIQLKLKRRKNYESAYIKEETIRPKLILNALNYLVKQPLFKSLKPPVTISKQWLNKETATQENYAKEIPFLVNPNDKDTSEDLQETIESSEDEEEIQIHETMLQQDMSFAPGEHNSPLPLIADPLAEEATFLKIFGGEIMKIPNEITLAARCKSFFRRYDRRCAKNIHYIFYMYKKMMSQKLVSAINMSLQRYNNANIHITVNDVLSKSDELQKLWAKEDLKRFLGTIRSSPVYWEKKKKDIFAMVRQLGTPTFFITFSPSERDWPELIVLMEKLQNNNHITIEEAKEIIYNSYHHFDKHERLANRNKIIDLLANDPVTTARYNENRFRMLTSFMVNPIAGPFSENEIVDLYQRTEFQTRGSPHIHMIIWCKDTPTYEKNRDKSECITMIDKYITCHNFEQDNETNSSYELMLSSGEESINTKYMPKINDNLEKIQNWSDQDKSTIKEVTRQQIHRHMTNCKVFDDEEDPNVFTCKYGYPFPILDDTHIMEPFSPSGDIFTEEETNHIRLAQLDYKIIKEKLEDISKLQFDCQKKKKKFESKLNQEQFMDKIGFTKIRYLDAIRSSINATTVFMKRSSHDININPYNKELIVRHRGNMDIQFILNSYGLVSYVTSYMMKSNHTMSRLLNMAVEDIENRKELSHKQKLYSLANKWQNCSEISAQECVYNLLAMPVSYCSREVVFIQTFPMKERFTMLKRPEVLMNMRDKNSTDIFQNSLMDYYACRPDEMEETCLAEFAAWYHYVSLTMYQHLTGDRQCAFIEDDHDDDEFEDQINRLEENNNKEKEDTKNKFLKLKKSLGYLKKRDNARIIRYRRYKVDNDPEDYYREQLLLFVPWRDEENEIEDPKDYTHFQLYERNKIIIAANKSKFENLSLEQENDALEIIEKQIQQQKELERSDAANDIFNANQTLMEMHDYMENDMDQIYEVLEANYGYHMFFENLNVTATGINDVQQQTIASGRIPDSEYISKMSGLNRLQHSFLMQVMAMIKAKTPFYYFLTGGGGTGKSFLLKNINQTIIRYMDHITPDIEYSKESLQNPPIFVLMVAFLGKVSFALRGNTIHSAFSLSPFEKKISPLKDKLESFQRLYKHLKLIIIDEVSLIDYDLFCKLDYRLKEIFQSKEPFANISIIVCGDFNQKKPIGGQWIFCKPSKKFGNPYHVLQPHITNVLWDRFQLMELKQVMRQENKEFSEALTQLGNGDVISLSKSQIDLFNSRIVPFVEVPRNSIHPFRTNRDVDHFNERFLQNAYASKAIDVVKNHVDPDFINQNYKNILLNLPKERTHEMPSVLKLQIGVRYMILMNQDVKDGLANGTTGILMNFIYEDESKTSVSKLYFDHFEPDVGLKKRRENIIHRSELLLCHTPTTIQELQSWTPMTRKSASIRLKQNFKWTYERSHYQLTPAEAITMYKIQGDTCEAIALDLNQEGLVRSDLYVAMSRVTKLEDLYLYGRKSLLEGRKFKNKFIEHFTEKEKKLALKHFYQDDEVQREMRRLRENCKIDFLYPFFNLQEDNSTTLNDVTFIFLNLEDGNIIKNMPLIKSDFGIKTAQVIILTNCGTQYDKSYENNLNIDGYTLAKVTGAYNQSIFGHCVYISDHHLKKSLVKCIDDNLGSQLSNVLEVGLLAFKSNNRAMFLLYFSCNNIKDSSMFNQAWEELKGFVRQLKLKETLMAHLTQDRLIVMATFAKSIKQKYLQQFSEKLTNKYELHHVGSTQSIEKLSHDWCMTNLKQTAFKRCNHLKPCHRRPDFCHYDCMLYDSFFSRHVPIWFNFKTINPDE